MNRRDLIKATAVAPLVPVALSKPDFWHPWRKKEYAPKRWLEFYVHEPIASSRRFKVVDAAARRERIYTLTPLEANELSGSHDYQAKLLMRSLGDSGPA